MANKEGWGKLSNSRKWHYFVNSESICRRWLILFSSLELERGNDESPDNCSACKKALKRKKKVTV